MRRYITIGVVLLVLVLGAYIAAFKRGMVSRMVKGYKTADTPQVAADMFKKAIQAREYEYAADYCTQSYAEQLRRGASAAAEYGEALDNLIYQMKERDLIRDEVKIVFYRLDPFPKDFTITVSEESGDTAKAAIAFAAPYVKGGGPQLGDWKLDADIEQIYVRPLPMTNFTTVVAMKKEDGKWKFDFKADNTLQHRVERMNDKYKIYINPFQMVTQEVKNDPNTRENTTTRLKSLLESAAKE
jgi:hypothetical protein